MNTLPKISIVTCSYNQGAFIRETIDSVLAQNYPNFEHIIVDNMSDDETLSILNDYNHLIIIREKDKGQSNAINKGFSKATGGILCFLNSDDTFTEGTLLRVAEDLAPQTGKKIIIGRCRFTDENGTYSGIEHPSTFSSHFRVLTIWKGHTIPQPAVFWVREVYEKCGGMDENEHLILDYDLFCRYSKQYHFYFVNQVFATYRIHSQSKTSNATDNERLNECINVSRKYWGPKVFPLFWRLTFSLWIYRFNKMQRAHDYLEKCKQAWSNRKIATALVYGFLGSFLIPKTFFYINFNAFLKTILFDKLGIAFSPKKPHAQPTGYEDFTDRHPDGWIGPTYISNLITMSVTHKIVVAGELWLTFVPRPLILTIYLDGKEVGKQKFLHETFFEITILLSEALQPGNHILEIKSSEYFILSQYLHTCDKRLLSWRMSNLNFI